MIEFAKLDHERRLAFGWAYVSEQDGELVVDHSGDFIDKAALTDLEDAAYRFVLEFNDRFDGGVTKLVESLVITPEKLDAMGVTGGTTGWWVGFRVFEDDVWAKVKDGTYSGFSIRGTGTREQIDA